VRFVGHREDALHLYALVDVLVHASTTGEPFGRVVIEGMAAARPVVATRAGAIPEIVREGETGILVPPGDSKAMADAILLLLRDRELARRMGERGREHVASHFQARQTTEQVTALYDSLTRH